MKKHILIWMTSMHLGGAERALIGLLNAIDYSCVNVDLFLNRHEGELLQDIPSQVNLLPEDRHYKSLAEPMIDTIKRGELLIAAGRLWGKTMVKIKFPKEQNLSGVSVEYSNKYTTLFMPRINQNVEYDLAISFITPHYFVAEKVNAKKKIAWIHTDYSKILLDVPSQLKMWGKYDYIASISDDVTRQFLNIFPTLELKIIKIENIMAEELIKLQAQQKIEWPVDGTVKLLSIGRFAYAKNFDNIPEICSLLRKRGLDVHWYIIGFGSEEPLIKAKIKEYDMDDYVHILGKKDNPYPYMASCDLYVQPSRFEGNCVSVREAQMLGKPVVISSYPTSSAQLEDGVDGVIVPLNSEGCAEGIAELLMNEERQQRLSNNCRVRDYSNKQKIDKLYSIMK